MQRTAAGLLLLCVWAAIFASVAVAQSARPPFAEAAAPMLSWTAPPLLAPAPAAAAYRIALRREFGRAGGGSRQGSILMIVGAAGIVTGLVVHEGLVTIAGAGVGGYGLYLYLRATRQRADAA